MPLAPGVALAAALGEHLDCLDLADFPNRASEQNTAQEGSDPTRIAGIDLDSAVFLPRHDGIEVTLAGEDGRVVRGMLAELTPDWLEALADEPIRPRRRVCVLVRAQDRIVRLAGETVGVNRDADVWSLRVRFLRDDDAPRTGPSLRRSR